MNQQKHSNSIGYKFFNYVNSLCTGFSNETWNLSRKSSLSSEKSFNSSNKPKRMTFLLDRALLKVSRKNLIVQQFSGQQTFNSQIQDHLINRVAGVSIAILSGDFSQKVFKKIALPLKILRDNLNKNLPIQSILASSKLPKTRKVGPVNVMIFNEKRNSLNLIQQTLSTYYKQVKNFVFIIQAEVEAIEYHELFVSYRDHFIFEVEKIMVINKCIANIIYVSSSGQFLKIDNNALALFLSEQVAAKDPIVCKQDFANLTRRLLNAEMHVQTTYVIGQLISTFSPNHYDQEFVLRMKKKSNKSQPIIDEFLNELRRSYSEQIFKVPQFHQNTPEFKLEENHFQNIQRSLENSLNSKKDCDKKSLNVSFGVTIHFKRNGVID